ncbi:MAG: hypothetical protein H6Q14_1393 [Bacteroidetes bacterium]|nr:hypothetical protein [Bacteroidota bacterium]
MIPVYDAIQIVGSPIPERSGHNRPWKVIAMTPAGLKTFVVKLYDRFQVDDFHCVTNEIICNLLAKEFDFKAPDCALINIPEYLAANLPIDMQHQFEHADHRPKFATVEIQGIMTAIPDIIKKECTKRISLDTLYAFDNLILNTDRGNAKPNLLLDADDSYLIDHEFTFSQESIESFNFETCQLEQKHSTHHLFHSTLKRKRDKQTLFAEFAFYLHSLNINSLNPYFQFIVNEGFTDYSAPILKRLNQIKQKSSIFVDCLKGSIQ